MWVIISFILIPHESIFVLQICVDVQIILWIVGPYLFEIARVSFHWSNLFMNLKRLVTAGPLHV